MKTLHFHVSIDVGYLQSSVLLVAMARIMMTVVRSRAGEKEEQQSQVRNIAAALPQFSWA